MEEKIIISHSHCYEKPIRIKEENDMTKTPSQESLKAYLVEPSPQAKEQLQKQQEQQRQSNMELMQRLRSGDVTKDELLMKLYVPMTSLQRIGALPTEDWEAFLTAVRKLAPNLEEAVLKRSKYTED